MIQIFIIVGLLFNVLAVIGLLRFPDVYTRLHAGTKCTTFGTIFITLAIIIYGIVSGWTQFSIHAFFALVALLITNPTGAHAISRAAHISGIKPKQAVEDLLENGHN